MSLNSQVSDPGIKLAIPTAVGVGVELTGIELIVNV